MHVVGDVEALVPSDPQQLGKTFLVASERVAEPDAPKPRPQSRPSEIHRRRGFEPTSASQNDKSRGVEETEEGREGRWVGARFRDLGEIDVENVDGEGTA